MNLAQRVTLAATGTMVASLLAVAAWVPIDKAGAIPRPAPPVATALARPTPEMPESPLPEPHGDITDIAVAAYAEGPPLPDPAESVDNLVNVFERMGYDLAYVLTGRSHVPRVFLASLPSDLGDVRDVGARKEAFFQAILPLVLQVNEEVAADRRRLWRIKADAALGRAVDAADRLWLAVKVEEYGLAEAATADDLLRAVDVVPPSLALAQAAEESGWGTSRFAREGNAIFGQWILSEDSGIVPADRAEGASHRIRSFESLLDSVRAYVRNLNTHRAYRKFREVRADYRRRGQPVDGLGLARTMTGYSQRGPDYVRSLSVIIEANNLRNLDDARLAPPPRPFQVASAPTI